MKTLALVIIAKNEEKGLAHCIESCRPYVDKVYVSVDSASTDKTFEIATKLADKVTMYSWNDDFAQARNNAQNAVIEDYTLFLDGHEYLEKCERLQEALALEKEGYLVTVRMESGAEFSAIRLFESGLRFVGQVHEQVVAKSLHRMPSIVIQHDRIVSQDVDSTRQRDEQREDQVPRIMRAELKADKKNIRASFHLMLHMQSKGDYKQALKYAKKYLKYSKDPAQRWYVQFSIATAFILSGKRKRAFKAMLRAEKEEPYRWEIEKMKGLWYFDSGKYDKALKHLVNSLGENLKDHMYKPQPRDDAGTWNVMGECFFKQWRLDRAVMAFKHASEECLNEKGKEFFLARSNLMSDMLKSRDL